MAVTGQMRSWVCRIGSWILLERDGVALWFACRHHTTPLPTKALCVFLVAYALFPIDPYINLIPGLRYLDDVLLFDVILLPGLIWLTIKLLPSDVMTECRGQASKWLEREGRSRIRWGIAFAVVVWSLVAYAISQFFQR